MKKLEFKAGESIVRDGTASTEMFVIRSGKVRVFKTVNGEKVELSVIGKNEMVGEMSLLLDERRTASLEAVTDTEIIALDKESVIDEIQKDPKFAMAMMKKMAGRIRELHSVIAKMQGELKGWKIIHGGK